MEVIEEEFEYEGGMEGGGGVEGSWDVFGGGSLVLVGSWDVVNDPPEGSGSMLKLWVRDDVAERVLVDLRERREDFIGLNALFGLTGLDFGQS